MANASRPITLTLRMPPSRNEDPANRPGTAAEIIGPLAAIALTASHTPGIPGTGDPSGGAGQAAADIRRRAARPEPTPRPSRCLLVCGRDARPSGPVRHLRRPPAADQPSHRDYTEGARETIRDDRIAKFFDADLDAKSQWPDPWLSLNPFFADGASVTDLVTEDWLHPECANIFQTGKSDTATTCDGNPPLR